MLELGTDHGLSPVLPPTIADGHRRMTPG